VFLNRQSYPQPQEPEVSTAAKTPYLFRDTILKQIALSNLEHKTPAAEQKERAA
jgi:hypothetical protein